MSKQSVSVGLGVPVVGIVGITDPGREEPELGVPEGAPDVGTGLGVAGREGVTEETLEGAELGVPEGATDVGTRLGVPVVVGRETVAGEPLEVVGKRLGVVLSEPVWEEPPGIPFDNTISDALAQKAIKRLTCGTRVRS